jgi:phytoene dehydrogenase-like protein
VKQFDALVVGSGPNGLSAAVALATWGFSVRLYEAREHVGGGLHTLERADPGFLHDECSAIHPMGILSPFFRSLALEEHGLTWRSGSSSVAHPLEDGPAAVLYRSFDATKERLGAADGERWRQLFSPLVERSNNLLLDLMAPFSLLPRDPIASLRFGLVGLGAAHAVARSRFQNEPARALFAGLAGHSIMPLEHRLTAAFGLIFGMTAHIVDWPCAMGGSTSIAQALSAKFLSLGGEIVTGEPVTNIDHLPPSRVVLLDVAPMGLSRLAGHVLPSSYERKLLDYKYGPGTFKLDYTLDGPIPWKDPEVLGASTVHVGGTHEEIAASEQDAWHGRPPRAPYLIVCQQSALDSTRAPSGKHTGYAYCHVPHGFTGDATQAMEDQLERFAPGFRDVVRTRHITSPKDFEKLNPNYVGGAVTGGAAILSQLFTRPAGLFDPYSTPNPRVFLCSASTPPGGGVHGMCGYYAARSAARRLGRKVPRGSLLAPLPAPLLCP